MKINILNAFLDALFPPRCLLCDEVLTPDVFLCDECSDKLKIDTRTRCIKCGNKKSACECDKFIYLFDGAVSPYFNSGPPKDAYYKYKFDKSVRSSRFFAERMAESVNEHFANIKFSFITRVPRNKGSKFDHTKYLCDDLSECLSLEYKDILRTTDKERETQHRLSLFDRFSNVDNAYEVIAPCDNKTVLLLDDIKTTGATMNECARRLKMAGAREVYCISVLIGSRENER